jgi:hypothetical protein
MSAQLIDRLKRGLDASVINDLRRSTGGVLERDVEVGAQQHPPAIDVKILQCPHLGHPS